MRITDVEVGFNDWHPDLQLGVVLLESIRKGTVKVLKGKADVSLYVVGMGQVVEGLEFEGRVVADLRRDEELFAVEQKFNGNSQLPFRHAEEGLFVAGFDEMLQAFNSGEGLLPVEAHSHLQI